MGGRECVTGVTLIPHRIGEGESLGLGELVFEIEWGSSRDEEDKDVFGIGWVTLIPHRIGKRKNPGLGELVFGIG